MRGCLMKYNEDFRIGTMRVGNGDAGRELSRLTSGQLIYLPNSFVVLS